MDRSVTARPLSLIEAIIPVASLILFVGLSYYLFGDGGASGPNQVALVVATLIAVLIGRLRGHSLEDLRHAAVESVGSGIGAIFILLAVGSLIGTWAMSGTLVGMVYYGLRLLSPDYFYAATTIISALVAFCIGSSWTVVGTLGIGLMGIGANMGLDPAITAAAIIGGAYFGDTTSPLSDSSNLAAATAGVNLYQHIREALITSGIAVVLAIVVYFFWEIPETLRPATRSPPLSNPSTWDQCSLSPWALSCCWPCSGCRRSPPSFSVRWPGGLLPSSLLRNGSLPLPETRSSPPGWPC